MLADWQTYVQNHLHALVDPEITSKYIPKWLQIDPTQKTIKILIPPTADAVLTPATCPSRGGCWTLLKYSDLCTSVLLAGAPGYLQRCHKSRKHLLNPHAQLNDKWKLKPSAKCKQCSWGSPSGAKKTNPKWQRQVDGQIVLADADT